MFGLDRSNSSAFFINRASHQNKEKKVFFHSINHDEENKCYLNRNNVHNSKLILVEKHSSDGSLVIIYANAQGKIRATINKNGILTDAFFVKGVNLKIDISNEIQIAKLRHTLKTNCYLTVSQGNVYINVRVRGGMLEDDSEDEVDEFLAATDDVFLSESSTGHSISDADVIPVPKQSSLDSIYFSTKQKSVCDHFSKNASDSILHAKTTTTTNTSTVINHNPRSQPNTEMKDREPWANAIILDDTFSELINACKNGDILRARNFLQTSVNINFTDHEGKSPLHWACELGHEGIVKLLISKGANVQPAMLSTVESRRDKTADKDEYNKYVRIYDVLYKKLSEPKIGSQEASPSGHTATSSSLPKSSVTITTTTTTTTNSKMPAAMSGLNQFVSPSSDGKTNVSTTQSWASVLFGSSSALDTTKRVTLKIVNSEFLSASGFQDWFEELSMISSLETSNGTQREALLMHLFQMHTNVASYRISELKRLKFSLTPFQYYSQNHYLRTSTLELTDLPLTLLFGKKAALYLQIVERGFEIILKEFYPVVDMSSYVDAAVQKICNKKNFATHDEILKELFNQFKPNPKNPILWIGKIEQNIIMKEFWQIFAIQLNNAFHSVAACKKLPFPIEDGFGKKIEYYSYNYSSSISWIGVCENHSDLPRKGLVVGNRVLKNFEFGHNEFMDVRKVLNKSGYWPDKRSMLLIIAKWIIKQNENLSIRFSKLIKYQLSMIPYIENINKNEVNLLLKGLLSKELKQKTINLNSSLIQLNESHFQKYPYTSPYIKMMISIISSLEREPEFKADNSFINFIKHRFNQSIQKCFDSADDSVAFTRSFQDFLETLLIYLKIPSTRTSLPTAIIDQLKHLITPQQIRLTNYAMQSVTQILLAAQSIKPKADLKIGTLIQSYFEIKEGTERMEYQVEFFSSLRQVNAENQLDILFVDFHPNNASQDILSQNHIKNWLEEFMRSRKTPFILVVDVTLNTLVDKEIHELLTASKPYIDYGTLNLIFLQSLTKFAQLGLDILSAGLDITFNNDTNQWKLFNDSLRNLFSHNMPQEYDAFFSLLLSCPQAQSEYISLLRNNTSELHKLISSYLEEVPVQKEMRAMDVTFNSDGETCYVSLNLSPFFNFLFSTEFSFWTLNKLKEKGFPKPKEVGTKLKEAFVKLVLFELIEPLLGVYQIPITFRQSIGMALTTLDQCVDKLRLKVGVEPAEQLNQYALFFAEIAGIISFGQEQKDFFVHQQQAQPRQVIFPNAQNYFKEVVKIISNKDDWILYQNFSLESPDTLLDVYYHPKKGFFSHTHSKITQSNTTSVSFLKELSPDIQNALKANLSFSGNGEGEINFSGVAFNQLNSMWDWDNQQNNTTEEEEIDIEEIGDYELVEEVEDEFTDDDVDEKNCSSRIILTVLLCRLLNREDLEFSTTLSGIEMTGFTEMETDFLDNVFFIKTNLGMIKVSVERDANNYTFVFSLKNEELEQNHFDDDDTFIQFKNHDPVSLSDKITDKEMIWHSLRGEVFGAKIEDGNLILFER